MLPPFSESYHKNIKKATFESKISGPYFKILLLNQVRSTFASGRGSLGVSQEKEKTHGTDF